MSCYNGMVMCAVPLYIAQQMVKLCFCRSSTLRLSVILFWRYQTFLLWLPSARSMASPVSLITLLPVQPWSGLSMQCCHHFLPACQCQTSLPLHEVTHVLSLGSPVWPCSLHTRSPCMSVQLLHSMLACMHSLLFCMSSPYQSSMRR